MSLNFGGTVLRQPILIRAKGRTTSSADSHQNLLVRSNLHWEMRNLMGGLVFGDSYLLMVGQVKW
jgi:hypothetical protein